jgi:hypothetical protein
MQSAHDNKRQFAALRHPQTKARHSGIPDHFAGSRCGWFHGLQGPIGEHGFHRILPIRATLFGCQRLSR